MGPSPHLWFLDAKERLLDQNNKTLWVLEITCRFMHAKQRDLLQRNKSICVPALICVFGCKTATLGTEPQVSVGPRPNLWLFQAKQRLLEQNNKSLWVLDMTCRFVHVQQRA